MRQIKLYDHIKRLLEDYPALRDSDKKLIWNVWGTLGFLTGWNNDQLCKTSGAIITRENFMDAPSTETIRRCRQKIQELNPDLRSSQEVMEAKIEKKLDKGTFIYREPIQTGFGV